MRAPLLFLCAVWTLPAGAQDLKTRQLNELNWMEVGALVPSRIQTVLLPVGTLEAYGVGPNGADNVVPDALARDLAPRLDALIAPLIPYGVNTSLDEYAGTFGVSGDAFRAYALHVLRGLARTGFRNIVVLNGHGPNYEPLNDAALQVFRETAALLAVRPDLVHPERYRPEQTSPIQSDAWRAYPFPSTIGLYQPGQGYPQFDARKAQEYWKLVEERVLELVRDVIRKWEAGGR
ncbi:MAG: creatininase family protein [Gemmatimonadetes bacterium]|nr:creatininase family protein [Gemmatimonadota bacterium]